MPDAISTLRDTELFGLLSDDVLEAVVSHSSARSYAADERVFSKGDDGDALYVLETGGVRIVNDEGVALATLAPPATFGELGLIQQRRTASAEATQESTVRAVGREAFLELMREHPTVSDALYRAVGEVVSRVLDRTSEAVLDLHGPQA